MALAQAFLLEALRLIDVPYLWGGKTNSGIDCSGLVTYALWKAGGPDLRQTHGSEALQDECKPIAGLPPPGALAFYRRHVMVHVTLGIVVGACGGGETTTSVAKARQQGARVKVQASYQYRKDFLGWGLLPHVAYDVSWGI